MKNTLMAVAIAAALFGPCVAQAQVLVTSSPPSRVTVPTSGASVAVPYRGTVLYTSQSVYPCGSPTHTWTRDGIDAQGCSGLSCQVIYHESAATRGPHTARDAATTWTGYSGMYGCHQGQPSASRSYIVQYAPTAQLVSAPSHLAVDEGASFHFSGTADSDYAAGPVTYTLDFGDGTRFAGSAGYYFYSAPGDYVVTFTVDDGLFQATAQHTVHVYGDQPCGFGDELICQ